MKHSNKVTVILLFFFLAAQFIGLAVLNQYIDTIATQETGETQFKELSFVERPPVEEETSFIPVIVAVAVGTFVMLFLLKRQLTWVFKIWFALAAILTLFVAFDAFIPLYAALVAAIILGIWKVFKPNFWVHNGTEIFVYAGLAAIFVPIFNLVSISILMVVIAAYDAYAVWKSKHMVTLAEGQKKSKVFAGLMVPYNFRFNNEQKKSKVEQPKTKKIKVRTAVLGGGDIGFPLLFAGVVLKEWSMWQAAIIPLFALVGLALLLYYGKQDRYYPAMPFIGAGCFVGFAVAWVLQYLL